MVYLVTLSSHLIFHLFFWSCLVTFGHICSLPQVTNSGTVLWAVSGGGLAMDAPYGIALAPLQGVQEGVQEGGVVYVTGTFYSRSATFGTNGPVVQSTGEPICPII
jgi:hypothetical protein